MHTANHSPAPSFWAMCCAEPFRVFFPLGLLAGIAGLSLWPMFFWGVLRTYPALVHSRLMIEGFMAAFILGFLGTAGPRLLSARHFSGTELGSALTLYLATLGAHLSGRLWLGDALFLALLLTFVTIFSKRFVARGELPPPNFVLVGCGMLSAIVGTALVLIAISRGDAPRTYLLGTLLLEQGFVLLPLLGVGVFLFPRFLGVPFGGELEELRKWTPWWKRKALLAAGAATVIAASFVIESSGFLRLGGVLRFLAAALYIATQMPSVLTFRRAPFAGQCIRAAVWLLLAGLLWPVFLPAFRVAGLHLVFIGGFMLTAFTVATRVILGHSGQAHLFSRRLPFLVTTSVLLVAGMATRVGADFMPGAARNVHLIYAALLCMAAAIVWAIRLVPRVVIPDADDEDQVQAAKLPEP
ncbi:MAG: NnrS family protein [Chthoniobacteraceae bacterium]